MKRRRLGIFGWILLALSFSPSGAFGAACTSFTMTQSSSLPFTQEPAGATAEVIAATSGSASLFNVTCNPSTCSYTIMVPGSASSMTGPGAAISVDTWTKNSGKNFRCVSGTDTFTIGATRAALDSAQAAGDYSGTFTVTSACCGNPTANGTATIHVMASIGISKNSDLAFGQAAPGDGSKTVAATSGASFSVTGEPSTAYTISLPSSVTMTTGAGSTADTQIVVDTFTSNPSSSGSLSAGGAQTLYVGATRAAIRSTQTAGYYSGSFTVTVAY